MVTHPFISVFKVEDMAKDSILQRNRNSALPILGRPARSSKFLTGLKISRFLEIGQVMAG